MAQAQFQMPDAKQMSGIPRPVTDLPNGSVSIRLIRGDLSNNITGHPVELHVGSNVLTVKTDENGRAQFDKLTPGAAVKALAVVDGERLESQEFPVPPNGGVRMMLVATDKNKAPATTPDAPAISGQVTIGGESRIVVEPGDENVRVFYLLDVNNSARAPVNPLTPFAFELPRGAVSPGLMDGSSPIAAVDGPHVTVKGPFPPGHSFIQIGFELPGGGGAIDVSQRFPANLEELAIVVLKVGPTTLASKNVAQQRELASQGRSYIAATGGAVAAGQPIDLTVSGFPHHSRAPRFLALGLAMAVVAIGLVASARPQPDAGLPASERKRLLSRRDRLFADLVKLEADHRAGRGDERRYAARRAELMAALENLYHALDDTDAGPRAAQAVAAGA